MVRKVTFLCDRCGTEHDIPPLSLWLSRADATLKVKSHDNYPTVAIPEDGLLNFCSGECLQEYFLNLVLPKEIEKETRKETPK
ncbi:MAG: hypothetical protein PHP55_11515 [Methanoculleus sp.]|jgi:hypothetical protein|nr:hypothetical protein [Methanoculleus sp.]